MEILFPCYWFCSSSICCAMCCQLVIAENQDLMTWAYPKRSSRMEIIPVSIVPVCDKDDTNAVSSERQIEKSQDQWMHLWVLWDLLQARQKTRQQSESLCRLYRQPAMIRSVREEFKHHIEFTNIRHRKAAPHSTNTSKRMMTERICRPFVDLSPANGIAAMKDQTFLVCQWHQQEPYITAHVSCVRNVTVRRCVCVFTYVAPADTHRRALSRLLICHRHQKQRDLSTFQPQPYSVSRALWLQVTSCSRSISLSKFFHQISSEDCFLWPYIQFHFDYIKL